ncbi:protein of unknown function [Austwickia chelonae]|uniref:Protein-glutamine gamma-glutamyltransferase-like C-terminal domain-containing protein n=1 Tax=Austwickia chelonae NBRC 105200 TaxID=1184607 RepID=K6UKY4_9MICO|nr:DUF4129 domain-containing protein [Austwickia chelonae]GAB76786.1 hypothetical protein AUCHE_03_00030 [Austwickia chelonae NBRC 105200]SEW30694.1 protein of unknown function [Austwickia chelonae]
MNLPLWSALAMIDPSPDEARRWAQEELAKPAYQEPWLMHFARMLYTWLIDLLNELFSFGGGQSPVHPVVTTLAVLLVVATIIVLFARTRMRDKPEAEPEPDTDQAVLPFAPLSAAEYRARAQSALADDPRTAAMEAYRAIAAGLQERHVVDVDPGRTAREFANEAATAYPTCEAGCGSAVTTFEAACYGGLVPERTAVEQILTLESRMRAEKPVLHRSDAEMTPLGVPR